jgi:hypothetical protein
MAKALASYILDVAAETEIINEQKQESFIEAVGECLNQRAMLFNDRA